MVDLNVAASFAVPFTLIAGNYDEFPGIVFRVIQPKVEIVGGYSRDHPRWFAFSTNFDRKRRPAANRLQSNRKLIELDSD